MQLRLLSCSAHKPDRRAIAKVLEEFAGMSPGEASEQTGFLLEGSELDIDVTDDHLSSAYRAFRKHDIEYEILD